MKLLDNTSPGEKLKAARAGEHCELAQQSSTEFLIYGACMVLLHSKHSQGSVASQT